jgi:hypothetical protein
LKGETQNSSKKLEEKKEVLELEASSYNKHERKKANLKKMNQQKQHQILSTQNLKH